MEFLREKDVTPERHEIPLVTQLQENLKDYLLANSKSVSEPAKTAIENILKDESLLVKYIRVRKGDALDARKWILRKVRAEVDLYPELPPPDELSDPIRRILNKRIVSVLTHADPDGRLIMVFDVGAWDPAEYSVIELLCTCRYLTQLVVDYTNCYDDGITLIVNGVGVTFSHVKLTTMTSVKRCIDIFHQTHAMPSPRVFYVNAPFFVYPLVRFFKPVLPKKFKERLVVSSGLAELHEQIPLQILPECLGGALPDEKAVTLSFLGLVDDC